MKTTKEVTMKTTIIILLLATLFACKKEAAPEQPKQTKQVDTWEVCQSYDNRQASIVFVDDSIYLTGFEKSEGIYLIENDYLNINNERYLYFRIYGDSAESYELIHMTGEYFLLYANWLKFVKR